MQFKHEVETRKIERSLAGKRTFFVALALWTYGNRVWQFLLVSGELGNEANVGVFLASSAVSPPKFALIEDDVFYLRILC